MRIQGQVKLKQGGVEHCPGTDLVEGGDGGAGWGGVGGRALRLVHIYCSLCFCFHLQYLQLAINEEKERTERGRESDI